MKSSAGSNMVAVLLVSFAWASMNAEAQDVGPGEPNSARSDSANGEIAREPNSGESKPLLESFAVSDSNGARHTTMQQSGNWFRVIEHRNGFELQRRGEDGKPTRKFFKNMKELAKSDPQAASGYLWVIESGMKKYGPAGFGPLSNQSRFGGSGFGTGGFGPRGFGPPSMGPGAVGGGIPEPDFPSLPTGLGLGAGGIPGAIGAGDATLSPLGPDLTRDAMKNMMDDVSNLEAKRKQMREEAENRNKQMREQMNGLKNRLRRSF